MAATSSLAGLRPYLVPALAVLAGIGVAAGIATAPGDVLNGAIDRSGIAALVPAAASPIGVTGRTLAALAAGGLVAMLGFVTQLGALLPRRAGVATRLTALLPKVTKVSPTSDAPVVRRADAHPDCPPRRPIRAASDLGAPLPIFGPEDARAGPPAPPVEQPLPADLDQPMSVYDPGAVPPRPRAVEPAPAPLARAPLPTVVDVVPVVTSVTAKVEAISPEPAVEAQPEPVVEPIPEPIAEAAAELPADDAELAAPEDDSIAGLLARLERGTARRRASVAPAPAPAPQPEPEPEPTLDETLQRLRRLAAG